jgi:hypothetical protein
MKLSKHLPHCDYPGWYCKLGPFNFDTQEKTNNFLFLSKKHRLIVSNQNLSVIHNTQSVLYSQTIG